jgi:hypothetical protein
MPDKPKRRLFGTMEWSHWPDRVMAFAAVVTLTWSMCSTRDQLRLTRQALILSQRPWVVQDTITHPTPLELTTQPLTLDVVWKNTGAGPARDLRVLVTVVERTVDFPLPDIWSFWSTDPPATHSSIGLFGPGQTKVSHFDHTFTDSKLADIMAGRAIFDLVGWATYRDVFETTHWVTFCVRYNPHTKVFDYCDAGNDTGTVG